MKPEDERGKIWFNGKYVDWWDAKIHVMSHCVHYGTSIFEGMRCYETQKGSAIFRLHDHIKRFFDSAKIYRMDIPFSMAEIEQACVDIVRVNQLKSAYIRPLVFRGYNTLGVDPSACPVEVVIAVLNWGAYLGEDALTKGVDVRVSSWHRMHPNTHPALAKTGANYMNSQLIKWEAKIDNYAEGIALSSQGFVSEGSGENIFLVRNNEIFTPTVGSSILPGITRDSVFKIARELGYEVKEMLIPREMLYIADELFFTGTAAEVSPIRSVDKIVIGSGTVGPITKQIQNRFFEIVRSGNDGGYNWLTFIN
ncbi:MAG: branched-chain amino acid transaminase [candidate division KSB1 bacterium]|nr:branched-chain amino acid transaminase [candidate division KSB1 bacterium]MDZ7334150.1 branched-chain amino acid transaminase [candidate division KSB1 bacterium]MDZ7357398.1 branched-chain amino acid transaminase [candidate division KSB1 bacterium]MDZ7375583.1 branched-chain amino acid transaminase [candidate division KSB1 bacterium]MDZ7401354.1 branched-chain amino acid transaminase [candidate division KSB1 bacterium]